MSSEITEAACQSVAHYVTMLPNKSKSQYMQISKSQYLQKSKSRYLQISKHSKRKYIHLTRCVVPGNNWLCIATGSNIMSSHQLSNISTSLKRKSHKDVKWFHEYYWSFSLDWIVTLSRLQILYCHLDPSSTQSFYELKNIFFKCQVTTVGQRWHESQLTLSRK